MSEYATYVFQNWPLDPIHDSLNEIHKNPSTLLLLISICLFSAFTVRIWHKYICVPAHLAHLPRISIISFITISIRSRGFLKSVGKQTNLIIGDSVSRKYTLDSKHKPGMWMMWMFGKWVIVVNNPADVRVVLTANKKFEKISTDYLMDYPAMRLIGKNVLIAQTHDWARQRRVIYPAFKRGWSTHVFGKPARALISRFDQSVANKSSIDVMDWMQRVTLDVLSSVVFGRNLDSVNQGNSDLVTQYNSVIKAALDPSVYILSRVAFLIPSQRNISHQVDQFNNFLNEMIDQKVASVKKKHELNIKGSANNAGDLMELMVEAMLNDDIDFHREDVRSNAMVFFIAGHDTSAAALSFAIYLMALHPEVQEKARLEVLKVIGDTNGLVHASDLPYPSDLQETKLNYLTCVIKETMRLYPPVTSLPMRVTTDDHTFTDGTFLPEGSLVTIDMWDIHRSELNWGETSNIFNPSRWESSDDVLEKPIPLLPSSHDYKWIPFGGGSRICMGQQFSVMEQKVVLAMMLLRYEWTVVGNQAAVNGEPDSSATIMLHPKHLHIQLTRRN